MCVNVHISNIGKIWKYLDRTGLEHAFVTFRLDHCNSPLCDLLSLLVQNYQRIQNMKARIATENAKFDHTTLVLRDLFWIPVCQDLLAISFTRSAAVSQRAFGVAGPK